MDERCSSYVDFAVKGMMNESWRGGVRVSTLHTQRKRERRSEESGDEREALYARRDETKSFVYGG